MMAQAGLSALYLPRLLARISIFCWQSIPLVAERHRNVAFSLTLGASALAGALVISAIIEEPILGRQEAKLETIPLATVPNETVIYQQARPPQPNANEDHSEHSNTEQIEASDQLEDDDARWNFPHRVRNVRFVNPDAPADIGKTAAAHATIREVLIKIGGFVAFRPKEEDVGIADEKGATLPCKRTGIHHGSGRRLFVGGLSASPH
jgi:hypothetical protein